VLKIDNVLRSTEEFAWRWVIRSRKVKENVFKYTYTRKGFSTDGGFKVTLAF